MNLEPSTRHSLSHWLALNRTVGIVLVTVLFFGLGEQLWEQFMPVYLEAQTKKAAVESAGQGLALATLLTIGIYACLRNFFEGFCYIGGGQLTARLGDRGSLILIGSLTVCGYALFLTVPFPAAAVVAALLILGWEPLSVPATFTTVGSSVEPARQGMAFALQSIQKRLPKIIGPFIAGRVLEAAETGWGSREEGRIAGMQLLVGIALVLGVASLAIQLIWMPKRKPEPPGPSPRMSLREFHPTLRRLLLAEVFTRWCDWLVREFVVLYLVLVRGVSLATVGDLIALQNLTALLTYLPIGQMTKKAGLQPFIGLSFIFFALFPLVLSLMPSHEWLFGAFIVYGLREIGEPARKALITSLMPEQVRPRGVGLYWGLRSFATCWASLVGALVWFRLGPEGLLHLAFGLGGIGAAVYYLFCRLPPASTDGNNPAPIMVSESNEKGPA